MAAKADTIEAPPKCGLACIKTTLVETRLCAPTNQTCICTNVPLNNAIELCVAANCTVKDSLLTKRYSTQTCGIEGKDRTGLVWIVGITFGAVGLAAFFLRCVARLYVGTHAWGLDDWFMCAAVALMVPLCAISIPLSQHGLGLDMWNVSFEGVNDILFLYYWDEMIYITSLALTKVSILCFYLKVFPARSFRNVAYVLIGLNLVYAITYDFLLAFQCQPIDGAWLFWDGEYKAKCISINVLGWSAAGVNIGLDLATIILPLPSLFQLSMSMKKKAQIVLMFAVGFFVTFVSIIRLRSLIEFGTTQNVTQDYVEVGYWSTIEVPVGIICACMPAIRSLFSLVFPKVFGTTRGDKSSYALNSFSPASKLSSGNKLKSQGGTSTSGGTQIKVKQEWAVMSNPVGNESDEHLVGFDRQIEADSAGPTRKMTLQRQQSAPAPWQDDEKIVRETSSRGGF
ncbi:CFEM domain protein [Apiospora aurea]|uniref:CFEM domain protein n=1 Tax=Apiospora aurea TaxID=335848 RepID=A0ABR1QBY5_9PEZI